MRRRPALRITALRRGSRPHWNLVSVRRSMIHGLLQERHHWCSGAGSGRRLGLVSRPSSATSKKTSPAPGVRELQIMPACWLQLLRGRSCGSQPRPCCVSRRTISRHATCVSSPWAARWRDRTGAGRGALFRVPGPVRQPAVLLRDDLRRCPMMRPEPWLTPAQLPPHYWAAYSAEGVIGVITSISTPLGSVVMKCR